MYEIKVSALRARLFLKKPDLLQNAVKDGFLARDPRHDSAGDVVVPINNPDIRFHASMFRCINHFHTQMFCYICIRIQGPQMYRICDVQETSYADCHAFTS